MRAVLLPPDHRARSRAAIVFRTAVIKSGGVQRDRAIRRLRRPRPCTQRNKKRTRPRAHKISLAMRGPRRGPKGATRVDCRRSGGRAQPLSFEACVPLSFEACVTILPNARARACVPRDWSCACVPRVRVCRAVIIDYKTGKAPSYKYSAAANERIRRESFFQLRCYALLLQRGAPPRGFDASRAPPVAKRLRLLYLVTPGTHEPSQATREARVCLREHPKGILPLLAALLSYRAAITFALRSREIPRVA